MNVLRFVLFLSLLLAPGSGTAAQRTEKPSILIILADDLGFADVGFNGGKTIKTPNLDRFAARGYQAHRFSGLPDVLANAGRVAHRSLA